MDITLCIGKFGVLSRKKYNFLTLQDLTSSWHGQSFGHNRHGPSNIMLPCPRPTSLPSGILIHLAIGHNRHGPGRGLPLYLVASSSIQLFCHNRHGPKIGGSCSLFFWGGGKLGPHLTQSRLGQDLPPCQVALNQSNRLATTDMGWNLRCVPLLVWAGSPFNTQWPGPRRTCMPSFILVRPTVWPQYTNVTDRTDRETGQWSDFITRTVLQMVAQKWILIRTSHPLKCSRSFFFPRPNYVHSFLNFCQ